MLAISACGSISTRAEIQPVNKHDQLHMMHSGLETLTRMKNHIIKNDFSPSISPPDEAILPKFKKAVPMMSFLVRRSLKTSQ